jgi:hypothetical protein
LNQGETQSKLGAKSLLALDLKIAPECHGYVFANCQAEADTIFVEASVLPYLCERSEQLWQAVPRNANTRIFNYYI